MQILTRRQRHKHKLSIGSLVQIVERIVNILGGANVHLRNRMWLVGKVETKITRPFQHCLDKLAQILQQHGGIKGEHCPPGGCGLGRVKLRLRIGVQLFRGGKNATL